MTTNNNNINPKKPVNFSCELCNFKCSYNKDFQRHINTKKHKNNILTTNNNKNLVNISKNYQCQNCTKEFNDRAGLWRHKKKCIIVEKSEESFVNNNNNNNTTDKDELISYLMKENKEFKLIIKFN